MQNLYRIFFSLQPDPLLPRHRRDELEGLDQEHQLGFDHPHMQWSSAGERAVLDRRRGVDGQYPLRSVAAAVKRVHPRVLHRYHGIRAEDHVQQQYRRRHPPCPDNDHALPIPWDGFLGACRSMHILSGSRIHRGDLEPCERDSVLFWSVHSRRSGEEGSGDDACRCSDNSHLARDLLPIRALMMDKAGIPACLP